MKGKKDQFYTVIIIILTLLVHLISYQGFMIEKYYSLQIYPFISLGLIKLFGWIPFSAGDLLYALVILWVVVRLCKLLKNLIKNGVNIKVLIPGFWYLVKGFMLLYIFFNILWGFNYNRSGIATQLQIHAGKYSKQDLILIDSVLLVKVNECRAVLLRRQDTILKTDSIFTSGIKAYQFLSKKYEVINYSSKSVKSSFFGWMGNYLGFIGYYNPFTGEAQVNTTVPAFIQPFTVCHEIAHQLGYAKENEANFVGYLAATASPDTVFKYSAYLDLFLYAQTNLSNIDTIIAKRIGQQISAAVKYDIKTLRDFNLKHRSIATPLFRWFYGIYLQQNEQPTGMLSYDEVTSLLFAYYKKNGTI